MGDGGSLLLAERGPLPEPTVPLPETLLPAYDPRLAQEVSPVTPQDVFGPEHFLWRSTLWLRDMAAARRGDASRPAAVGLSAAQAGLMKSAFVAALETTMSGEDAEHTLFVNPRIVEQSPRMVLGREGCRSTGGIPTDDEALLQQLTARNGGIPIVGGNVAAIVEAPEWIVVEAAVQRPRSPLLAHSIARYTGIAARIIYHEILHGAGIRCADRVSPDHPGRLHLVPPNRFGEWRENWQTWPHLCPQWLWRDIKTRRIQTQSR